MISGTLSDAPVLFHNSQKKKRKKKSSIVSWKDEEKSVRKESCVNRNVKMVLNKLRFGN